MALAYTQHASTLVAFAVCVGSLGCGNTTADSALSAQGDASAQDASNDTACPDGERYIAEQGCLSCDEATDKLHDIVSSAMDGARSCTEPQDCKIAPSMSVGDCYYRCPEAYSHAGAKAVEAAFEQAAQYCMCGGPLHPPFCPDVQYKADCVHGVCTLVKLTDGGDH